MSATKWKKAARRYSADADRQAVERERQQKEFDKKIQAAQEEFEAFIGSKEFVAAKCLLGATQRCILVWDAHLNSLRGRHIYYFIDKRGFMYGDPRSDGYAEGCVVGSDNCRTFFVELYRISETIEQKIQQIRDALNEIADRAPKA